ncbi:hypothetical protein T07_8453 [Trichinella nelsoni]|uniref:Uncharacterized protein n=1 Tax=Trichinella nelsoni TaxID=6336 RepID=A0A0V0RAU8_9BILA|nr:hypothetical protein T07_8453 [Trichinella nelsoni]
MTQQQAPIRCQDLYERCSTDSAKLLQLQSIPSYFYDK